MKQNPVFYLLAGPNGAGKSTLFQAAVASGLIPAELPFINADLYEASHLQHIKNPQERSKLARAWADAEREKLILEKQSFISETVFSHPSKLMLLEDAKRQNFIVMLLIVCLDDSQRLLERVRQRVREGGHPVSEDKILTRYPRTLSHLQTAVKIADIALLYDTGSHPNSAHRLVAACRNGSAEKHDEVLPTWAKQVLGLSH